MDFISTLRSQIFDCDIPRIEACQLLLERKDEIIYNFSEFKKDRAKNKLDANIKLLTKGYQYEIDLIENQAKQLVDIIDIYESMCSICCKQVDISEIRPETKLAVKYPYFFDSFLERLEVLKKNIESSEKLTDIEFETMRLELNKITSYPCTIEGCTCLYDYNCDDEDISEYNYTMNKNSSKLIFYETETVLYNNIKSKVAMIISRDDNKYHGKLFWNDHQMCVTDMMIDGIRCTIDFTNKLNTYKFNGILSSEVLDDELDDTNYQTCLEEYDLNNNLISTLYFEYNKHISYENFKLD